MPQTHRETHVTKHEVCQPGTGQEASTARLPGAIIPTALVGPAQQGREPYPIILPRIAIGASVAPHVPVLPAGAPLALEQRATLVLTPVTNEEKGEATGTHEQHPQEEEGAEGVEEPIAPPPIASPEQERGYPVITTPIPTPGDLHHTTPFPSSPVQHQRHQWSPRNPRLFLAGLAGGLLLYFLALVLVAVFVAPVVTLAATVTLVPEAKTLSTTLAVTALSTGTPEQARKQVAARVLDVNSPTQSQTVSTTGTGHAPARVGEGTVTFYNAAPYAQTVAAGTVLTGANGVEIVTDAPAVTPAGNPPIEGEMTVPAHATTIGPQGNIAPLDLNGLCCMAGISVKNATAFHDGQDAYDYPMVTQADINQAAEPLLAALTPATQDHVQGEVHSNERLTGPVACQPAVTPDHPVGSNASQVTVSVSVTCHAQVYDHEAVVRLVTNALMQQATTTLGTGYALRGTISTTITQAGAAPHAKPGTLTLLVTGLWTDGSRLPADPARLHLLVAMGG